MLTSCLQLIANHGYVSITPFYNSSLKSAWKCWRKASFTSVFVFIWLHEPLDQNLLNSEINKLRDGLEGKVATLREMEGNLFMVHFKSDTYQHIGSDPLKGFNLKGIDRSELWKVTDEN